MSDDTLDRNPASKRGGLGRMLRRLSLTAKIGIGLLLGVFVGLFLGEGAEPLDVVAKGYVRLLQMTVLPYVMVSLVAGIGSLDMSSAKLLLRRAGVLVLTLWAIALALVVVMPLAFPDWQSATFFSNRLLESPEPFDFLGLYIPSNPFHALANNVVPSVVFFSGVVGVALISIEGREPFLHWLQVVAHSLAGVNRFVVRLSPIGLFAITATIAGTIRPEELAQVEVYLVTYAAFAALLFFWIVPGLLSVITPVRRSELFATSKDALLTAFVTGELFVALPILGEAAAKLVQAHSGKDADPHAITEVIVPAAFSMPHAGKVLSLSFVLFAGWFADAPIPATDLPRFAATGILSAFGSLNAAVPYLLDQFQIPADTFELFIATSLVNSRVGTAVAAMHTLVLAVACAFAMQGRLRIDRRRALRMLLVSVPVVAVTVVSLRTGFDRLLEPPYSADRVPSEMHIIRDGVETVLHATTQPVPAEDSADSQLARILARGRLRVGYFVDSLPYAFASDRGQIVGFDVELAHRLAEELGLTLELMPVEQTRFEEDLAAGRCDVVMSGVVMTPRRAAVLKFSEPYLDEHLSFVSLDSRRREFASQDGVRGLGRVRLGMLNLTYFDETIRRYAPEAEVLLYSNRKEMVDAFLSSHERIDAMVTSAERGSAWSLKHPQFSVSVPKPPMLTVPLAYPVARRDAELANLLDSWIALKRRDGTLEELYAYWVLGHNAQDRTPRWSIMRDVLGWR